ncbi:MAG TPA: cupin domain-containing protein [Usitatibacter sp.]|nr:cupin domain-containing protein [Usitatibacter sp.]
MTRNPPAGLDVERFMARHWQRRPLLLRGAFERFRDPLTPAQVLALAGSEAASSRLVRRIGKRWTLEHGPFPSARFKQLPRRDWTVLVQDTNHFAPRAARLLERFDFISHARIDDVMASYAAPGGGVGPHVDSYDVFLLQGLGRRKWQISRQADHAFVPGLPLKVLARFVPDEEWVLEAGDMLYLPPGVAHHGVALSECLTWSIGFRAPGDAELVEGFLDYLRDRPPPRGQYRDPGAAPTRRPAAIPEAMVAHAARAVAKIRWSEAELREYVGLHLSEVKAHVFFEPPPRPLAPARFAALAASRGLDLDPRSRLLFSGRMFFINGERAAVPAPARALARRLADRRRLDAPLAAPAELLDVAYGWYLRGYLKLQGEET